MSMREEGPTQISLEDLIEVSYRAVLQAQERRAARAAEEGRPITRPGPITVGIVWWPEGGSPFPWPPPDVPDPTNPRI